MGVSTWLQEVSWLYSPGDLSHPTSLSPFNSYPTIFPHSHSPLRNPFVGQVVRDAMGTFNVGTQRRSVALSRLAEFETLLNSDSIGRNLFVVGLKKSGKFCK